MRFIFKIIASLFILLLMAATIALILLHTRHGAGMVNSVFRVIGDARFEVADIEYSIQSDPRHLRLIQPIWHRDGELPLQAQVIDLWLAPQTLIRDGWHFDSLLIQGLTLNSLPEFEQHAPHISTQRLALTELNLMTPEIQLNNARLELDQWHNQGPLWTAFSGDFRLSADEARWQDQILSKLLIDGERSTKEWTIYGASFNWRHAGFNGQAEYLSEARRLIVHQLTATRLQLDNTFPQQAFQTLTERVRTSGLSLELRRLDVLDSSVEQAAFSANQASLSLENWHWPGELWQQTDARLTLNADTLRWHDLLLESPLAELQISPGQINLNGFSARLLEGYVRTEATLTPDAVILHQLKLNGVRWVMPETIQAWLMGDLVPQTPLQTQLSQWWHQVQELSVDQLSVNYSQLTGTYPPLPFQLSDINLEGTGLVLLREGQPGLWQGQFAAGAGFTNVRQITVRDPWLTMRSQAGHWQITQLSLPIGEGLLEGKGDIHLNESGWPWQFKLSGDSLPAQLLTQWLGLPLPLQGAIDLTAKASGLGEFHHGLAYSLQGELDASFRKLALTQPEATVLNRWQQLSALALPPSGAEEISTQMPVTLSPLQIRADRGRIRLAPMQFQSEQLQADLSGEWDLATPSDRAIQLNASDGCQQITRRWHDDQQETTASSCERNSI
ncbi:AsmA family protein [Photobacterium sp. GJ3]|uniref:AsmA family protein n=1 Tax=Photobacterium sp. GJ3 TaxID=2829502 RepID=UPI001B8B803C|nr:AsmA family protein [Photobacterium sp. GJ3]QUJ67595.1 AsmA family protein [Photobacterium sp. GJ3]